MRKLHEAVETADKILDILDSICKELNITYVLFYGTCLGFYRDGGYITNDNDIDIGVITTDEQYAELTKRLLENGFVGAVSCPSGQFWLDDVLLDLFMPPIFYFHLGRYQAKYIDKFETVTYKNRVYNVPCHVKKYLKTLYTDDWKTKKIKQW